MLDKGEPDDKILAVPVDDPAHGEYFDIADLPAHYLREIRVQHGWTQTAVAKQLRSSQSRVAKMEAADASDAAIASQ